MDQDQERRQFRRISFSAPVVVSQGEWQASAAVVDISLKGILIRADNLNIDQDLDASIHIRLSDEIHINMMAELAHHDNNTYAFRWVQVDIESMVNLRRLLELNTGDILLMERELSHLRGE